MKNKYFFIVSDKMSVETSADLLCRVDFPLYSTAMVGWSSSFRLVTIIYPDQISPRHLMLAGGGGAANTGVKNGFEIFEITTNGENVIGESVTRFYTGEFSVYSLAVRPAVNNNVTHRVLLAAGHNEFCQVYSLSLERWVF